MLSRMIIPYPQVPDAAINCTPFLYAAGFSTPTWSKLAAVRASSGGPTKWRKARMLSDNKLSGRQAVLTINSRTTSCRTTRCQTTSCRTTSCRTTSCPDDKLSSRQTVGRQVVARRILVFPVTGSVWVTFAIGSPGHPVPSL